MSNFVFLFFFVYKFLTGEKRRRKKGEACHKCFKCWWLALPKKNTITKPLINSSFNPGLTEGPSYPVPTII